jgi:hypothetical protein
LDGAHLHARSTVSSEIADTLSSIVANSPRRPRRAPPCIAPGLSSFSLGLPIPEWEYSSISLNDVPLKLRVDDVLNDAGNDGSKLVGVTANNLAYLKRQISKRPLRSPPASTTAAKTKNA